MSGLERSWRHISSSCAGSATSSSTMRPTCTWETPPKPSAGRARSTAWPCGSRIPSFGRIRTRARTSAARARLRQPGIERLAGDALVGLLVALARAVDHVLGDLRSRRRLVPAGARCPVPHELLVETRLRAARLVRVGRPEARRVRSQHLVADDDPPGPVAPELELRVGQD